MSTYKIIVDSWSNRNICVLKDNYLSIPFDEGNTDYQEYLKWLEAGNTPEPADTQE